MILKNLENDDNWKGNFDTFLTICLGERLKSVTLGLCGCKEKIT